MTTEGTFVCVCGCNEPCQDNFHSCKRVLKFYFLMHQQYTEFHVKCHSENRLREDSNLVWKCSYQRAAIYFRFVFSFHKESQQFPFPFNKYRSPSNEAKAVLFQDVIAVLDHLRAGIVRLGAHEKTVWKKNSSHFNQRHNGLPGCFPSLR